MDAKSISPILSTKPKDGIAGLKENWKTDLVSGFVLFLIALPLSIGIAIASGAPPSAGLLAAIVGGIGGSLLGGSHVTINGAAAGLIVIVLGSVQALGHGDPSVGFKLTLAAIAIAGAIQIVMGFFKLGTWGLSFPEAVIHGMLTAIGVIIMIKQAPVALGVKPHTSEIFPLLFELPNCISRLNPEIALIGAVSLAILIFFAYVKTPLLKRMPGPLVVVIAALGLGKFFNLDIEHTVGFFSHKYTVGPSFLLNVPTHISEAIISPDFSQVTSILFIRMTFSICLVASIESVLSTFAVDKLDPFRRSSDLNRDLMAKGFCNMILGMIGGLPIISEIVRSSANVSNGARTRWSNFFHGFFLLIFVVSFPQLLHEIPLASLASILIVVGYRLSHPHQFLHAYKTGPDHFIVFMITLITTLATDLLVGVGVGVLAFALVRKINIKSRFNSDPLKEIPPL